MGINFPLGHQARINEKRWRRTRGSNSDRLGERRRRYHWAIDAIMLRTLKLAFIYLIKVWKWLKCPKCTKIAHDRELNLVMRSRPLNGLYLPRMASNWGRMNTVYTWKSNWKWNLANRLRGRQLICAITGVKKSLMESFFKVWTQLTTCLVTWGRSRPRPPNLSKIAKSHHFWLLMPLKTSWFSFNEY